MSPPTPPSPPIISRPGRDENGQRASSRGHHRTAREYRASRSRSRGRGRSSRVSPERRHRQRTHSRSRSRDTSRYRRRPRTERSPSRHRRERSLSRHRRDRSLSRHRRERSLSRHRREKSPSTSRVRRRRSSHRSRSRSYSKTYKSSHRSKSRTRSHSRSRQRHQRSRSGSKSLQTRDSHSRAKSSAKQQANVIVLSTESYKDSLKSSSKLPSVKEEPSSSSSSTVSKQSSSTEETPSWKKAKVDQIGVYSNLEPDAPIDKEKIHREIEEKLRLALAREGKVYPYPKPEPSHPVFANDGSFLEIFKKMQQQQTFVQQQVGESMQIHAVPTAPVAAVKPVVPIHHPPPPQLPVFGRRRGGKILKTGVVAKPQSSNDSEPGDVKDFWSIYLREVKKYKSTACESESKTRPLVR